MMGLVTFYEEEEGREPHEPHERMREGGHLQARRRRLTRN